MKQLTLFVLAVIVPIGLFAELSNEDKQTLEKHLILTKKYFPKATDKEIWEDLAVRSACDSDNSLTLYALEQAFPGYDPFIYERRTAILNIRCNNFDSAAEFWEKVTASTSHSQSMKEMGVILLNKIETALDADQISFDNIHQLISQGYNELDSTDEEIWQMMGKYMMLRGREECANDLCKSSFNELSHYCYKRANPAETDHEIFTFMAIEALRAPGHHTRQSLLDAHRYFSLASPDESSNSMWLLTGLHLYAGISDVPQSEPMAMYAFQQVFPGKTKEEILAIVQPALDRISD